MINKVYYYYVFICAFKNHNAQTILIKHFYIILYLFIYLLLVSLLIFVDFLGLERLYSSMTNLNAAVKRELPHSAVEQQNSGEKPKAKRQKKTVRATQQQQLTIQQQKVLQEHNFKLNSQIFQQAERPYQQPGQLQTALGVRR